MAYKDTFKEFVTRVREDSIREAGYENPLSAYEIAKEMNNLLEGYKTDSKSGGLQEVLGLKGTNPAAIDFIEAAFRTLALNLL